MQIMVPSILETSLSGRLGEVQQTRGKVTYTVYFVAGNGSHGFFADATRNGVRVPLNHNKTVKSLVAAGIRLFA